MTNIQLNRLTKERYFISQKLISGQDQILLSDKNFSFATNDSSTPEEFSKFIDNLSLPPSLLLILAHKYILILVILSN